VAWWRFHRVTRIQPAPRAAAAALLAGPVLLSILAIAAYGHFLTGGWLPDIHYRRGGVGDEFHWPWNGGRDLVLAANGAMGLLFDQQWGLLVHSPVYVLTFVGLLAILRSRRRSDHRLLGWFALLSVPYFVVISSFNHWGGLWCPPGRYLLPLAPCSPCRSRVRSRS
jgi:hypothetical protein